MERAARSLVAFLYEQELSAQLKLALGLSLPIDVLIATVKSYDDVAWMPSESLPDAPGGAVSKQVGSRDAREATSVTGHWSDHLASVGECLKTCQITTDVPHSKISSLVTFARVVYPIQKCTDRRVCGPIPSQMRMWSNAVRPHLCFICGLVIQDPPACWLLWYVQCCLFPILEPLYRIVYLSCRKFHAIESKEYYTTGHCGFDTMRAWYDKCGMLIHQACGRRIGIHRAAASSGSSHSTRSDTLQRPGVMPRPRTTTVQRTLVKNCKECTHLSDAMRAQPHWHVQNKTNWRRQTTLVGPTLCTVIKGDEKILDSSSVGPDTIYLFPIDYLCVGDNHRIEHCSRPRPLLWCTQVDQKEDKCIDSECMD